MRVRESDSEVTVTVNSGTDSNLPQDKNTGTGQQYAQGVCNTLPVNGLNNQKITCFGENDNSKSEHAAAGDAACSVPEHPYIYPTTTDDLIGAWVEPDAHRPVRTWSQMAECCEGAR